MLKRNRIAYLLPVLCFVMLSRVYAEDVVAPTAAGIESPTTVARQVLEQRLDHMVTLLENGEFIEAKQGYEEILKDPHLTKDQLTEVQKGYENLKMKLLFSRGKSENSVFYKVVPGDSLYKIAKKHGTTIGLIKKANGLVKDTIHPGMSLKIIQGEFSVLVDKSDNELKLRLDKQVLKRYPVSTGENNSTPTGTFKITTKLEDPIWYKTGAIIEAGSPENGLGTRWLGFDFPGYGIHGTIEPESIGKQISAGCVRMYNHDVEELYAIIPRGTEVIVID